MQYQTFKPTILNDSTNQQQQGIIRPSVKFESRKIDQTNSIDENKKSIAKQIESIEQIQEIEEQKSIIEGQNQFIQILRNSIESKLQIEGFQIILEQIDNMSREQKIDLFALITQLYQELSIQNQQNTQVDNLQQLVDNLNKQINCYAKELMELKVDKQYLLDQLDQLQGVTKDDDNILFKEALISKLELENQHLKTQIQQLNQQNEKYQEDLTQLEKRLNKIHLNLKTEECEKEELIKELENLKQTFYKSQVKEEHKLELNLALKEQELEFSNNKIKKLDAQIKELNLVIEEQQKQIGTQKYQIENLQQQHQLQYDQLEIEMNQYRNEIHEQQIYCEQLQQQLSVSEQFIQQIIDQMRKMVNTNETDIFNILQQLQDNIANQTQIELRLKQSEQEKSQIIFDLQHQFTDSQQNNQQLSEQISILSAQTQQYQSDIKQMEKQKRMFRLEFAHMKQLDEQKNQEIKELQTQFQKFDKKFSEQLEKSIKIEKENAQLKEQLSLSQQQLANMKNQVSNKKCLSFSQSSFTEQKAKNYDYIALLQTFEKVKPLFPSESLDLVQEMHALQNKLVRTEEIDSQLIQEEIKIQQKISIQQLNIKNMQAYLTKLISENKKLKLELQMNQPIQGQQQTQSQECLSYDQGRSFSRFHKQSMSVHTKPKFQ
ncbi:unnamed protein product [Paramecium sonneborni]|uniref:Uncharacterized protein n=1 Tax=Paramecium sonneborni TaxID=65129 RepID=A0A8S1MJS4_9CILI|nr:unnamed protein product [Paramecium sonneborni]